MKKRLVPVELIGLEPHVFGNVAVDADAGDFDDTIFVVEGFTPILREVIMLARDYLTMCNAMLLELCFSEYVDHDDDRLNAFYQTRLSTIARTLGDERCKEITKDITDKHDKTINEMIADGRLKKCSKCGLSLCSGEQISTEDEFVCWDCSPSDDVPF